MTYGGPWHARRLAFGDEHMRQLRELYEGLLQGGEQGEEPLGSCPEGAAAGPAPDGAVQAAAVQAASAMSRSGLEGQVSHRSEGLDTCGAGHMRALGSEGGMAGQGTSRAAPAARAAPGSCTREPLPPPPGLPDPSRPARTLAPLVHRPRARMLVLRRELPSPKPMINKL